jgi:hypothetical protein
MDASERKAPASQSFRLTTVKYRNPLIPSNNKEAICPTSSTEIVGAKMNTTSKANHRCLGYPENIRQSIIEDIKINITEHISHQNLLIE